MRDETQSPEARAPDPAGADTGALQGERETSAAAEQLDLPKTGHPADSISPKHPDRPSRASSGVSTLNGSRALTSADQGVVEELSAQSPVLTLDSAGFHGSRSPTSAQAAGSLARSVAAASLGEKQEPASPGSRELNVDSPSTPKATSFASAAVEDTPRAGPSGTSGRPTPAKNDSTDSRSTATSVPSSKRQLGEWSLGKTLGAGSMGKVKLAVSTVSGEKVAVKIVPRFTSTAHVNAQKAAAEAAGRPRDSNGRKTSLTPDDSPALGSSSKSEHAASPPTRSYIAKAHAKDLSKEVRTVREASIVLLLHHPYICGMRSMLVYPHHYYMVFEYVNGGQMLDYIISHGRLRERSARKFARQIGSSLEYCHANSIVHRDLKIENILISKTGNIKIIDFGLSNLYSPRQQLSTFCGSLYFAAPELLNAKPYTGPEVDIWSFGIVLYVLVCGKVPFDDQSMPALHAKIKRGQVEYPAWLSAECKHLLSRMLVTSPHNRASLREILHHPWMVKTFDGPPSSHLPAREPLRLGEIDREVIKGMTGFEFGTPEEIEERVNAVLASEAYCLVLKAYDDRGGSSPTEERSSPIPDGETSGRTRADSRVSRTPSKRFSSGLDFYRKKLSSLATGSLSSSTRTSTDQREDPVAGLDPEVAAALGGRRPEDLDPTKGFDPLLSIYFLVREKIERERIYGPGLFASSTLSLSGPPPPPLPAQAYRQPAQGSFEPPRSIRFDSAAVAAPERLVQQPRVSASAPTSPMPPQRTMGRLSEDLSRAMTEDGPISRPSRMADAQPAVDAIPENGAAPASPTGGFSRRFNSLLGRATSVSEADYRRHRQRASLGSVKAPASTLPQVEEPRLPPGLNGPPPSVQIAPSSPPAADEPAVDGERKHAKGLSLGNLPSLPASGGRTSRHASLVQRRRPSTGVDADGSRLATSQGGREGAAEAEQEQHIKPVYLKGLFSVATTSTKSPATIRNDLQSVLERLGVEFKEIKGGFECAHRPSIDLSGGKQDGGGTGKRFSKLGLPGEGRRASSQTSDLSISTSPASPTAFAVDSASSTHMQQPADSPPLAKPTDGLDRHVASDLVIRFEIFVVKVPWLPGIHGVQFRRKAGNAWTYSMLARRILNDLKL